MPYFIICPIYALLFVGLLLVSAVLFFIKSTRSWSSYIACGAAGTIPGFILGNILFWLVAWGLVNLMLKPIHQILSDIMNGAAASSRYPPFVVAWPSQTSAAVSPVFLQEFGFVQNSEEKCHRSNSV